MPYGLSMAANGANRCWVKTGLLDDFVRGLGKQRPDEGVQLTDLVRCSLILAGSKQAMANLVGIGGGMRGVNRYGVVLERHQHGINAIHAGARHQPYPGFHSWFSRLMPVRVADSSRGKRRTGRFVVL